MGTAGTGGGGGGGGGGGTLVPPPRATQPPFTPALLACAASSGALRADYALPGSGYEAALFVGTDRATLFAGTPLALAAGSRSLVVRGLSDGLEHFVGLALRSASSSPWTPSGLVLRARPAAPIHVDAAADPRVADGRTPATAFADLSSALITAALAGGGNVLVRDGEYAAGGLLVFPGTQVCGGFDQDFQLEPREPRAGRTILRGTTGTQVLAVGAGGADVVLDGLVLDGAGTFPVGIDVDASPVELRSVTVTRFATRGLRLRNANTSSAPDVLIAGCAFADNGGDGVSGSGAFDLRVDASVFDANVQEGFDFDDLVAGDGQTIDLSITNSRCFGNGTEGVDVDFAAPAIPGAQPGAFRVDVRGCRFENNGLAGILLDVDYETAPGWSADLVVRECYARGNGGDGFHVDGDAAATVTLFRLLASCNGGDGIEVTSETAPGIAVVCASVALGNAGAGVRAALGNRPIVASHCAVAGNAQGGFASTFTISTVSSSITHLQLGPAAGFELLGSIDVADPALPVFAWAPRAYATVLAQSLGSLTLSASPGIAIGDALELADDGALLRVAGVTGNAITVEPAPSPARVPATLLAFDAVGRHVVEDFRLADRSVALGRGLAPSGQSVDPGPFGAPGAGTPGFPDLVASPLLRVRDVTPAPVLGLALDAALDVAFSAPLDASTLNSARVRVIGASGNELQATRAIDGERLRITPPNGVWPEPFRVELHAGLRGADASPFLTPVVLFVTLR